MAADVLTSLIDGRGYLGTSLTIESRERLARLAREYEAPAGEVLLHEGESTRELSVVLDGRVALSVHVAGRGSETLMTVEPLDIFGWSALTPPFLATSTVSSLEPVRVRAFDGARLRAALPEDTELAAEIYRAVLEAVARRLGATRHQLLDLFGTEPAEAGRWFG